MYVANNMIALKFVTSVCVIYIHIIVGISSLCNTFRTWMTENSKRNANKSIKINITGHMSSVVLASLPYCFNTTANMLHMQDIATLRRYIEKLIKDKVIDIEVAIDWQYNDIESANNKNNNNTDSVKNYQIFDLSDTDSADSVIDDDAKADILDDPNFNMKERIGAQLQVKPNINLINNTNLSGKLVNFDNRKKPLEINYHYYYTTKNSTKKELFNNNGNPAKIKYTRTMNLALMWDYCCLMRQVFAVFCTLWWPKDANNTTPVDIKNAQKWGRNALYKAAVLGKWLLHDYGILAGGIGTYMLEAFWHYNPHGHGFYIVNQQMTEHWNQWCKQDRSRCGSANEELYLDQITDNYDVNVLGYLLNDLVDWSKVVRQEKLNSPEKFDLDTIIQTHAAILSDGPILYQMYAQTLGEIQVNDNIPQLVYDLALKEQHKYVKIGNNMQQQLSQMLHNKDSTNDSNDSNVSVKQQFSANVANLNNIVKDMASNK